MDSAAVVPPYTAKPLRLEPFTAVMLSPSRVADPASARALARPYRDVAARLVEWVRRGHALRDVGTAVYLHEYTSGGLTIRGLVGLLDMSARAERPDQRAIWPHEAIHPDQASELAARMEEMRLNPAPILLVHDGREAVREVLRRVAATLPECDYVDRAGQKQRVWAIRDPAILESINAGLSDVHCLLADGHHRYAAYLALQERHPGTGWDHALAMLVDQADTPLFLGPIHRTLAGTPLTRLCEAARLLGADVTSLSPREALASLSPGTLVATDGQGWAAIAPHVPEATIVEWLDQGLTPRVAAASVSYHHSVDDTLAAATAGAVGVLLPSLDFDQVLAVVESGRLLPEKATSFQPKPSLGALMRPLPDE